MTPKQQALIEKATHLDRNATPGAWDAWEEEITAGDDLLFKIGARSRATAHDTLFVTEARSLVPALAAELKQAAEENARLRSQLADVAQALRAEKALSRLLSAEQEKTGDILG